MLLNVRPFELGDLISARLEVTVKSVFIGGGGKVLENCVDDGPEVSGAVKRSLEDALDMCGKVEVIFLKEEPTKAM